MSCPQGAVPGQPPSGYPWESPGADLALRHAHCHDATHGQRFAHAQPEGGMAAGRSPLRSTWFAVYASTISFGLRLLIAATLARGGWLDPLRAHRDLHPARSTKLAWRTNGSGFSRLRVKRRAQQPSKRHTNEKRINGSLDQQVGCNPLCATRSLETVPQGAGDERRRSRDL